MTERTVLKKTSAPTSDDDISINSSESEVYASDQEFLVERILAEKRGANDEMSYLILWAGYPEEKATWEPRANVQDPDIFDAWEKRKGLEAFDIADFDARIAKLCRIKLDRHRRRKEKRRRRGMPVSSSSSARSEGTEDSDEFDAIKAAEVNELLEDVISTRKAAKTASQKQNESFQDTDMLEGEESDASELDRDIFVGDKKKTQKKTLQLIREKRSVQQGPRAVLGDGSRPAKERAPTTRKEVLGSFASPIDLSLEDDLEQQQHRTAPQVEPHLAKPFKIQRQGIPKSLSATNSHPIMAQSSAEERPSSTTQTSTIARGKGATRGGHVAPRNVFQRREQPKKRRTLIETSSDATKDPKLFVNWRIRRKAQLAGREVADAAPDLTALGGLFKPSDPSSFQSLRPATLRKSTLPTTTQTSDEPQQPVEMGEPSGITDSSMTEKPLQTENESSRHHESSFAFNTSSRPAYSFDRHGYRAVCYFFHHLDSCAKGASCQFRHSDDPSLPVVSAPNKRVKEIAERESVRASRSEVLSTPSDALSKGLPSQHLDIINEICFFWHTFGKCEKGTNCGFVHDNSANLPVASDPRPRHRRGLPPNDPGGFNYQPEEYRHPRQEMDDQESKDRPRERHAVQFSSLSSDTSSMSDRRDAPSRTAREEPQTRPPWNRFDPYNAVCYFWNHSNSCTKGAACRYQHTLEGNLPIAPHPGDRPKAVCRYWARRDCYAGDRCEFLHPPDIPEPTAPPVGSGEPRKAVSFAIDGLEPEHDRPPERRPSLRPSLNQASAENATSNRVRFVDNSESDRGLAAQSPLRSPKQLQSLSPPSMETSEMDAPNVLHSKKNTRTTTINMEEYRERKESKILSSRLKELILGNDDPQTIIADFGDIPEGQQQQWGQSFQALRTFRFRQMVTAKDFHALYLTLPGQGFWHGTLSPNWIYKNAEEKMYKAKEQLRLYAGGLVSISADFAILIYPVTEEWQFLWGVSSFSAGNGLKYLIFHPGVNLKKPLASKAPVPTLHRKVLTRSLHGLSYRQLLAKPTSTRAHNFYLLFPPNANQTAAFLVSWLRASDSRCNIYSSHTKGSWNFFVNSSDVELGIVLIHESAVAYICELPSLLYLIAPSNPNRMFTFWCINDTSTPYPLFDAAKNSNLGQISVVRLFPHGHAFFLTPSFLIAEPEKARELIVWFKDRPVRGSWKLVCAHDIRTYLLRVALEKSLERDSFYEQHHNEPAKDAMAAKRGLSYQACEARFECHALISDMLVKSPEDMEFELYDSDPDGDTTAPIICADRSINPDDERRLINWFAGWSIRNLDKFRKYTVIGTTSSNYERAVRIKEKKVKETVAPSQLGHLDASSAVKTSPGSSTPVGTPKTEPNEALSTENQLVDLVAGIKAQLLDPNPLSSNSAMPPPANQNAERDHYSPRSYISPYPPLQSDGKSGGKFHSPQSIEGNNLAGSRTTIEENERVGLMNARLKEIGSTETNTGRGSAGSLDKDSGRNRSLLEGVLRSAASSRSSSRRGSTASLAVDSPQGEKMDIDSNQQGSSKAGSVERTGMKEIKYESTMAWYGRLKVKGDGWEHIYVEGWEKCFRHLGVR